MGALLKVGGGGRGGGGAVDVVVTPVCWFSKNNNNILPFYFISIDGFLVVFEKKARAGNFLKYVLLIKLSVLYNWFAVTVSIWGLFRFHREKVIKGS